MASRPYRGGVPRGWRAVLIRPHPTRRGAVEPETRSKHHPVDTAMMKTPSFDRRTLLTRGGAAALAAALPDRSVLHAATVAPTEQAAPPWREVYRSAWVPPGAVARVAYVTDHHYWPKHHENWGEGAQITSSTDRRMPDLVRTLNALRPDVSIHGGDVISAGGAFFPPPDEYAAQLAFQADFLGQLQHPWMALVGNHETLEAHYGSHDQLAAWSARFGAPCRRYAHANWRLLTLNSMLPNARRAYGAGDVYGNAYGLDAPQLDWVRRELAEAQAQRAHVVLFAHVPPSDWVNAADLEALLTAHPVVAAIVCGHWHRNVMGLLGGVPVLVRTSNVETPFGYHLLDLYQDGRLVVVQRSQCFPFEEFVSASHAAGKQGSEADRYLTLGGSSRMPLEHVTVVGDDASARLADGHLTVSSRSGRAAVLIDGGALRRARLTVSLVKASGDAVGAMVLADDRGRGGIEAVLTSRYSPSGKSFLRRDVVGGEPQLLRPSWFNIGNDLSYRLSLEVRDGRVSASWTGMPPLTYELETDRGGRVGIFVERGRMYVTELTLETLD